MSKYQVLIPENVRPYPDKYEIRTATTLVRYFKSDVRFIRRENRRNTPDVEIGKQMWEIKNPEGKSKTTIANQFRRARKQSENLCLDLRRIKLNETKAITHAKTQFFDQKKFKKLLIVKKSGEILAF